MVRGQYKNIRITFGTPKASPWLRLQFLGVCHHSGNPILGLISRSRIDEAAATIGVQVTKEEIHYLENHYVSKQIPTADK